MKKKKKDVNAWVYYVLYFCMLVLFAIISQVVPNEYLYIYGFACGSISIFIVFCVILLKD